MFKLPSTLQKAMDDVILTSQKVSKGFTLAELLIALLIIGEISTFTIPKIIHSQQNAQKKAVFKETYGAFSAMIYQATLTGGVTTNTEFWAYVQANLNAVKFCTDASAEGCWSGSTNIGGNSPTSRGILLHSGAMITDIDVGASSNERYWIDWNGTDGPNLHCDDQIPIIIYLTTSNRDGLDGIKGQAKFSLSPPISANFGCSQAVFDALL